MAPWLRWLVRRLAPHWVHNRLARVLVDVERYAGLERLTHPPGLRPMVLAPHPDDESFSCGGCIAAYLARGTEVEVVLLSDGRLGDSRLRAMPAGSSARAAAEQALVAVRQTETRAAVQALAAADSPARVHLHFLGGPDGALAGAVPPLAQALAQRLAAWRPDVVYLPFTTDAHADHHATNRVLMAALDLLPAESADFACMAYEVWSPIAANTVVDISARLERKLDALRCHASQMRDVDYAAAAEGLNRYRAVASLMPGSHAEAFFRAPLADYRRLHEALLP